MSSRPNESGVELSPGDESPQTNYHRDFYSWLMEQARHLRAGRWAALDRENLAEEIESLGREQFKQRLSVRSNTESRPSGLSPTKNSFPV
jgi:hypothetical protein